MKPLDLTSFFSSPSYEIHPHNSALMNFCIVDICCAFGHFRSWYRIAHYFGSPVVNYQSFVVLFFVVNLPVTSGI